MTPVEAAGLIPGVLAEIESLVKKLEIVRAAGETARLNAKAIAELQGRIAMLRQRLSELRAIAGAAGAGGGSLSSTAARLLPRLLGGALVLLFVVGVTILAVYMVRQLNEAREADRSGIAKGPSNLGVEPDPPRDKASTEGPLAGEVVTKLDPFGTGGRGTGATGGTGGTGGTSGTGTAPLVVEDRPAARRLIDPSDFAGKGEDAFIDAIPWKAVSGGIVSPATQKAVQAWEARINQRLAARVRAGEVDGVSDTWSNTVKWFGPPPAVVKAEFVQTGGEVTGSIWVVLSGNDKGFQTRRLPVTRGAVTGSGGEEIIALEAADGAVRGILRRGGNGGKLSGQLNGAAVELFGTRTDKLRERLEAEDPSPLKKR